MIKFIENSKTKLKFVSYTTSSFIVYLAILSLFIPLIYWCLYLSPISSSLTCKITFLNRVDCRLEEKSILNSHLTQVDIINVKKIAKHSFISRDFRIRLKANTSPLYFDINRFQKTYFYPSNPFSLIFFRNFNPLNWFERFNQVNQLDDFIKGKLNQQFLPLEQTIKGFDFLLVGLFIGILLLFIYDILFWFLTVPFVSIYEINSQKQTLTILCKRIFLDNIKREYKLDRIKQLKFDNDYKVNFNSGRIILEFDPDYDYPIDHFFNAEQGKTNFQIIKDFLEKNK